MRRSYPVSAAAVLMLVVAGAAFAATRSGGPVVKTPGKSIFKINAESADTTHFAPGTITVASGGTVTFVNTSGDEPHTVTISTKAHLPHSFNCTVCNLAGGHLKDPNNPSKGVSRPGSSTRGRLVSTRRATRSRSRRRARTRRPRS